MKRDEAEKVLDGYVTARSRYDRKGSASAQQSMEDEREAVLSAMTRGEAMHDGLPLDTRVRDILTDKIGTIVSYHCRFEVEWEDGTSTMDVHSRQLDHCGPLPEPPAESREIPAAEVEALRRILGDALEAAQADVDAQANRTE